MWTLGHSLVMLAAVQVGVSPPDTASTLEEASQLIYRYYESLRPGNQDIIPCRRGMAVKHGDLELARQTARECGSIDWFFPALRGFVEHRTRLGDGLAQFDSALGLGGPMEPGGGAHFHHR